MCDIINKKSNAHNTNLINTDFLPTSEYKAKQKTVNNMNKNGLDTLQLLCWLFKTL